MVIKVTIIYVLVIKKCFTINAKERGEKMEIKKSIINKQNAIMKALKNMRKQPLKSLAQIFPLMMVLTSLIGFIVAIVIFIVSGGYSEQIAKIKDDLLGGMLEGFTFGTVEILISGIVPTIIFIIFFAEITILVILYFNSEDKVKKIIVSVCLGIGSIFFLGAGFILAVGFGLISSEKSERILMELLVSLDGMKKDSLVTGLIIIALIGVISLIVFIILMFVSQNRWIIKHSACALLITYIIFPLTLILVENIIPMFIGLIAFVFIGGALLVIGKIFLCGGDGSSVSDNFDSSHLSTTRNNITDKPKERYQRKVELQLNTMFWVDNNYMGCKCVFYKNNINADSSACTVYEFEKGEVAIYNKGKRVMNIPGCKLPER